MSLSWQCVFVAGPRQPWHDIHCRLQGPVATDVLVNHVQRWLKQASDKVDKLLPLPEVRRPPPAVREMPSADLDQSPIEFFGASLQLRM